ncbi:hypothetical protein KIW84_053284 [Lathyrus oleraceus]|uniref:Uncharacterized protein n=1 Tax=Pisum sativum TaxID=3888 RepID=A0A9D4WSE4_PEA|nr:hypothetical protein KIW84_053284 [Pisum sativum]
MVVTYKDWHEMLPFALHEYRMSVRTSTGATPFSLVYGMEAVLPVEVQIPSLRVLMDVKLQEAEWVRTRYEELSLIEEKRLAAICHGQLYQQRMKRAFDKKVRPRVYHVGDMVLKRILPPQNDRRGKWTPNYEGPFVVKKVFSGGALLLTTMDGEDFPSPVNADAVVMWKLCNRSPESSFRSEYVRNDEDVAASTFPSSAERFGIQDDGAEKVQTSLGVLKSGKLIRELEVDTVVRRVDGCSVPTFLISQLGPEQN